jgi:Zn-dependent protease
MSNSLSAVLALIVSLYLFNYLRKNKAEIAGWVVLVLAAVGLSLKLSVDKTASSSFYELAVGMQLLSALIGFGGVVYIGRKQRIAKNNEL